MFSGLLSNSGRRSALQHFDLLGQMRTNALTSSTTHSGATGDSPFVEMSKKRGSSVVSASAFQRWAGSRFLCVPAAIDKGQPSAELAKYSAI